MATWMRPREGEEPWIISYEETDRWLCMRCHANGQVPTNVNAHTMRCFEQNLYWEHRHCVEKSNAKGNR